MLKNISRLEVVIADKAYQLTCDSDSPLAHVKESILKFLYYVNSVEEQVAAQKKAAEEKAENPVEEPVKEI